MFRSFSPRCSSMRASATTIIDNTFATPMNFRPSELGFDLSVHSCTKYLNGHSDIVAGAVIGKSDWIQRVKEKVDHLGGSLDPHAAFLLYRGIKTLSVRMRQQCGTAQKLAEFLDQHAAIHTVHYRDFRLTGVISVRRNCWPDTEQW